MKQLSFRADLGYNIYSYHNSEKNNINLGFMLRLWLCQPPARCMLRSRRRPQRLSSLHHPPLPVRIRQGWYIIRRPMRAIRDQSRPRPVRRPQDSDETKVVRIYRGTGYFDQAMAEKLRPNLAKAFAPAKSATLQPLPVAAIATGSVPAAPKPTKSDHL